MDKKGKIQKTSSHRNSKNRGKDAKEMLTGEEKKIVTETEDWKRSMKEFKEEVSQAQSPYLDYYTFEDRSRRLANRHVFTDDSCYVMMFERDIKGPKMVNVLPNIVESSQETQTSGKRSASSIMRKCKTR